MNRNIGGILLLALALSSASQEAEAARRQTALNVLHACAADCWWVCRGRLPSGSRIVHRENRFSRLCAGAAATTAAAALAVKLAGMRIFFAAAGALLILIGIVAAKLRWKSAAPRSPLQPCHCRWTEDRRRKQRRIFEMRQRDRYRSPGEKLMNRKAAALFLLSALAFSAAANEAAAIDRQTAIRVLYACGADSQKFCAGVVPGGGRIIACLDQHRADLSRLCAGAVATASLCVEDMRKFCSSIPRGGMGPCLKSNEAQLSPGCRSALAQAASY